MRSIRGSAGAAHCHRDRPRGDASNGAHVTHDPNDPFALPHERTADLVTDVDHEAVATRPARTDMPPLPPPPDEEPPEPSYGPAPHGGGPRDPAPSWQPVDLRQAREDAQDGSRAPVLLARKDGVSLVYPGCVNALIGESESGKSWVALLACQQVMEGGGSVAYLDFESDEVEVTDRLLALGVTEDDLYARFTYVRPEEAGEMDDFRRYLDAGLIVLDGITEAMELYGLSPLDNSDYAQFHAALPKQLTKGGAAVVTIDHVTKSKDGRGTYAIGGQHKKAALDGCALVVEPLEAFGRDRHGWSRLTISKDRRGYVRRHQTQRSQIGVFHLNSLDDYNVEAWIEPPDATGKAGRHPPTSCMQAVSEFMQTMGRPVSSNQLEKDVVGFATATIRRARDELVQLGNVKQEPGARNAVMHVLVRPYHESSDEEMTAV